MSRSRINVYLEAQHEKQLLDICAVRGLSKSSVIAAALASFLSPEGADRREAAIAKRLDKLTHQYERVARDQTILIETLALFIRYYLSVTAAIPESMQDAARSQGKARFGQFIEQLARHLQRGGSLVKEVSEEIYPSQEQFHSNQTEQQTVEGT